MTLAEFLLEQLETRALTRDERARLQCQIAADFEQRGQYDSARDALDGLWQGVGVYPALEGLSALTAAEVLLRVGALSGYLGSIRQTEGSQDAAKDLISESIRRFQAAGETTSVALAQSELGFCYRRAGAHDEARVMYHEALERLTETNENELQARVLLRLAAVETFSGRYNDSLRILTDSAKLFEESHDDALKGRFRNELACALTSLGEAERRPDYIDRAIIESTAAAYHFEQAGHISYRASVESNLGFLLYTIGRYEEAHQHLHAARHLFAEVQNNGRLAQVDETRARVLLAQGKTQAAESAIQDAVRVLSTGGEQGLLAEALTTQGCILSRLGHLNESLNTLRHAADLAEGAGAVEEAGRALLSLIEEHAESLSEPELFETYERANNLLRATQDAGSLTRLRACAMRLVYARRAALSPPPIHRPAEFWADFNLSEIVRAYEAGYVRQALIDGEGSVTRAARLLGLNHHATLAAMLDETQGRHRDLAPLRTPPETRKQSIINGKGRRHRNGADDKARVVKILCVEDYRLVADAMKETLEEIGCTVELCADGIEALHKIESKTIFHLFVLDNNLPGRNGLDLARCARQLPHRQHTPIIMFSASDLELAARRAGVDVFLRKPEDIEQLTAVVTRLLNLNTAVQS